MSHEKVKKIRITESNVFITSASNNVFPRYYKEWECKELSETLVKEGLAAVELAIFKDYEQGIFQPGNTTKYCNWLKNLRASKDYSLIDWRESKYTDDCPIYRNRKLPIYDEILKRFIIVKSAPTLPPMIKALDKFSKSYSQLNLF